MTHHVTARNLDVELTRTKLSFVTAATEREYRRWLIDEGIAMTRIGTVVSVLNWLSVLGVVLIVGTPRTGAIATWIGVVILPVIIGTLLATYRPRARAWVPLLTTAGVMLSGLSCVVLAIWVLERRDLSMAATIMVSQFAFTIFPLRVPIAIAAVVPFLALHLIGLATTEVGMADATWFSLGPVLAVITGCLANAIIERGSRERFRQARIIIAQGKTIERERARAEVAERGRELSEALARLTDSKQPPIRLTEGAVVEDRFRVIKSLGRGGMGEVFEVEQLSDGKHLAFKVLTGNLDREALMRFTREARIAAALDHPNVVEVVDVGVAAAGMFLVMELVRGPTLAAAKERFGDVAWARPVLRQIAEALAVMHGRGVIHRDLKPGNILLEGDVPKVTDFGISSLAVPDAEVEPGGDTAMAMRDPMLTRTGVVLGTPLYMAPELALGSRNPRPHADVWAFGVIAYELLTGRYPFSTPPILDALADHPIVKPAPLSAVDTALGILLARCLAENPDLRPTAAELATALR